MRFGWDIEATGLLNASTIDYTQIPFKLKDNYRLHCIVVIFDEKIVAFHDGPKFIFDGKPFWIDLGEKHSYEFSDYEPLDYIHRPLSDFPNFVKWIPEGSVIVGHNQINYDLLAVKLYFGIPYEVEVEMDTPLGDDSWGGKAVVFDDTMVRSKTLNPDRYGGHSLENLASNLGDQKMDFRPGVPGDIRFEYFGADMLYYNIRDVKANLAVADRLDAEMLVWDWNEKWHPPIKLEKQVMELITRQEHRGFAFDKELAEANLAELDAMMEERKQKIEAILPDRPATKAHMKDFTPPKIQFKNNGEPSANLLKFAAKLNGEVVEVESGYVFRWQDQDYTLPLPTGEPLVTTMKAGINDTTHIKEWLVGLGWNPLEYKEKDLTIDPKKNRLPQEKLDERIAKYIEQTLASNFIKDRLEFLELPYNPGMSKDLIAARMNAFFAKRIERGGGIKVLTNPSFTVGQDKELCPNLREFSEREEGMECITDITEYLTYRHRRNSILGGGITFEDFEEDDEQTAKGYIPNIREDGRIPTPAGTCDAACLTPDTLILTDKGMVPIVDVNIGDLVLTHEGVYKPVVDRINNGIKPILEILSNEGHTVTCTTNHPFLTEDGWKEADKLTLGTKVYMYAKPEEWRQIAGMSNYYISSWGRVMTGEGNTLRMNWRKALWSRADVDIVFDDGRKSKRGIGSLVLTAFVGDKLEGQECCHRDGNPCNNNVENLYWGTSKENSADASKHGRALRAARNRPSNVLSPKQAEEIRAYFKENGYKRGDDTRLAQQYGCSRMLVGNIRHGQRWDETLNEDNIYVEPFRLVEVAGIRQAGVSPTFDVTVADSHSYVANQFVTHNTSRFRHRVVVNVPRSTSLYGDKMRALFMADSNVAWQLGYDFSSLEARIEGHYCWQFEDDPDKPYCTSLIQEKPRDVHTLLSKRISEIIGRDFPRFSAKNCKYGMTYGAQVAKVAKTIGANISVGKQVFEAFWQAAEPLARLKEALKQQWEKEFAKKRIIGIDGRLIPTRSAHAILNSLFQGGGVICAKKTMVYHDRLARQEGMIVDFFTDKLEDYDNWWQQMIAMHKYNCANIS